MIFVDSNIPMYLVGAAHPNKVAAQQLLEQCIVNGEHLVSDAEVLQEILHRYTAINRRDAIQPAFDVLLGIVDDIYAIDTTDVQRARQLLLRNESISARDALHLAIMKRYGITEILSFDKGFDEIDDIQRIG